MTRPGHFSRNNSVVSRAVWQVAPSCWNHMSSISIPSNWGHKNSVIMLQHRTPFTVTAFPASFSKKYGPVTPPAQNPHQTVAHCACNGFSWITRGFSAPQIRQFCVFTYPSSWKCASSLKTIFFEKLPSTFWFSNTQLTDSRRCTWSVGLSSYVI